MKHHDQNWAVIIPMANEEAELTTLCTLLAQVFTELQSGKAFLVIDTVSTDNTLALAKTFSASDTRFEVIWAPQNRSVVDAYTRGYRAAYENGYDLIIEMDANLSHDPFTIPLFLEALDKGNECVFGSRFIEGGSMNDSPPLRKFLSYYGTVIANRLLATKLTDMTSGYQGFQREVVARILEYRLKSTGHFFQTEIRYLLRNRTYKEVPIHYQAPSPRISFSSLKNAWSCLWYYSWQQLKGNRPAL